VTKRASQRRDIACSSSPDPFLYRRSRELETSGALGRPDARSRVRSAPAGAASSGSCAHLWFVVVPVQRRTNPVLRECGIEVGAYPVHGVGAEIGTNPERAGQHQGELSSGYRRVPRAAPTIAA
jgi:hypothetical protein